MAQIVFEEYHDVMDAPAMMIRIVPEDGNVITGIIATNQNRLRCYEPLGLNDGMDTICKKTLGSSVSIDLSNIVNVPDWSMKNIALALLETLVFDVSYVFNDLIGGGDDIRVSSFVRGMNDPVIDNYVDKVVGYWNSFHTCE